MIIYFIGGIEMIKVTKKHLKNGITVIMVPDRSRKFTYAEIMIKNGGSTRNVLVADKNYLIKPGTFHLLEHNIIKTMFMLMELQVVLKLLFILMWLNIFINILKN